MNHRIRIIILSLLVAAALSAGLSYFHYIPDDTYIGLRYARNAARGEGFTFNSGERIEGYTNFLWLVILAAGARIGLPLDPWSRILSLVFSLATLVVSGIAAFELQKDRRKEGWTGMLITFSAPLVIASSIPFAVWSFSGTEIPLFMFLLTLGFLLLIRGAPPLSVLSVFGILSLVRPGGIVLYATAAALMLKGGRKRREVIAAAAVTIAVLLVPYLLWKLSWFGSVVPNTFYAKTGPLQVLLLNGISYTGAFIAWFGYLPAAALILGGRRYDFRAVTIPLSILAVQWALVTVLGGDWMPFYRLLASTIPIMAVMLSAGLSRLADRPAASRWKAAIPILTAVFAFAAMASGGPGYERFRIERTTVDAMSLLGERLGTILPAGTRLACGSTGAVGYFSDLPVIDILGLTEPQIARKGMIVSDQPGHMKTDGKHVLGRNPDLLLLGNIQIHRGRRPEDRSRIKVQEREIVRQASFTEDYEFINLPLGSGFFLSCYKRKDFSIPRSEE
jgi:hypothetical protein